MATKSDRVALFISVLLHSLLALLPWQEKPRPLAESSTPTISIPVVDASQLSTPPASESQPTPAAPSSPPTPAVPSSPPTPAVPSSPPTPAVPLSPPVAIAVDQPADLAPGDSITETSDSSIDEPAPEAAPYADLTPEAPITETSDSPIDEPAPEVAPYSDTVPAATPSAVPSTPTSVTPTDEAKIAADWENLVGHLKDQDEGFEKTPLLEIFNLFGESEDQVNQFFDENGQPKLDVSSFYLFLTRTPEQVLQTVVMPELTSNKGFDLQPQENFPAGLAYQLLQGEMLRYLIIVRLSEGNGSVLMLSESLPGLEPQKP